MGTAKYQEILVAIRLRRATQEQRMRAVQAVFRYPIRGRLILERPSSDDITLAVWASPFLESVSLVARRRLIVTVGDAADTVDLEIPRTEWNTRRGELEKALGGGLDHDVAELASTD